MSPVRFLSPIPSNPKDFIEPVPDDYFIWWLFRGLCISCHKPATEINEIEPRSRSKQNIQRWENRVLMCKNCHGEYHRHGVNSEAIAKLQAQRITFLKVFGREKYVDLIPLEIQTDGISNFVESELARGINMLLPDGLDFILNG